MTSNLSLAVGIVWALPWTVVGLLLGACNLLCGGHTARRERVIEFSGPWIAGLLRRVPIAGGASAVTLGHVVLAADKAQLARTRCHERVHVRQYERWGVFFVPAYLLASVLVWSRGGDPYFDNPFEQQAFRESPSDS